jgi:uncharacterized iron-regulated membrane protein
MFNSFRLAMTWLHTWFGLVLGFVLMVVFFFGSLSVFDREIDRWAVPESRFEPQHLPSFDHMLRPMFEGLKPEEEELADARKRVDHVPETLKVMNYSVYTTHRDPVLELYTEFALPNPNDPHDHVHGHVTIDPRSGRHLPEDSLKIGSQFFYPLHFGLKLEPAGYWIVAIAALVMLAALVSGVVIHKKLFREFFTFRPNKNGQRRTLDLHNLTGVVALPFHFMFPLTGLIIFAGIYFPLADTLFKPLHEKHEQLEATSKGVAFEASGVKAPLASVDAMVLEAKRRWAARDLPGEVGFLTVTHVGDQNCYVTIYRAGSDSVNLVGQAVYFAGPTGKVVHEDPVPSAVSRINEFMTGLHLQHFRHWLLRWLYVVGGLSGCVCIGTGLVFFVGKRRARHAAQGVAGARWVEAVAVATITGTLIATLSMLVANRALPADLGDRSGWQERIFWLSWLVALLHGALRRAPAGVEQLAPAWREQCYAIAALAPGAVLLNWITTGDHLVSTLRRGYWPVAGLDLVLLVTAFIAVVSAGKLRRREAAAQSRGRDADDSSLSGVQEAHG